MATIRKDTRSYQSTIGSMTMASSNITTSQNNINLLKPVGNLSNTGASGVWVDDAGIYPVVVGSYGITTVRIPLSNITIPDWEQYGSTDVSLLLGTIPDGCVITAVTMYISDGSYLSSSSDSVTITASLGKASGASDFISSYQWYDSGIITSSLLTAGIAVPYDSITDNSGVGDTEIHLSLSISDTSYIDVIDYAGLDGMLMITYHKASIGSTAFSL